MKAKKLFRLLLFSASLLFLQSISFSQNITQNATLEFYTECPDGFNGGNIFLECVPWYCGTDGTVDYFNACVPPLSVSVPHNTFGNQEAHSGVAYAGAFFYSDSYEWREYLQSPFSEPMEAGVSYMVSMWVSLADNDNWCGVEDIGIFISNAPPINIGTTALEEVPQITTNGVIISDKENWTEISGCYIANGGEKYITIGNFHHDDETTLDPNCPEFNYHPGSYYYIDDITVIKGGPPGSFSFDLGDPVTACEEYTIDPQIQDLVIYTWDNGYHSSELTVTHSGTYSVTIQYGCSIGEDSIEVTILNEPVLEIGVPADTLCDDESISISLPDVPGQYTWQDGSHELEYIIDDAGLFTVTLDNGCGVISDAIQVDILPDPLPFSLGEDVIMCENDQVEFNFDPSLGDFLWQDNTTDGEYWISDEGLYALTISNACGEVTDDIFVEVIYPPDFNLGPDTTLCQGEVLLLEIDESIGYCYWQDGSDENALSIITPGTYRVTVSNDCGVRSDSIVVHYIPGLVAPDLGADITICPGDVHVYYVHTPGVSCTWSDGSTADSLIVSIGGKYSLQIADNCTTASDTVEVVVADHPPVIDLPASLAFCNNDTIVIDAGISGVAFQWNTGANAPVLEITSPGNYSLTVSNSCGMDSDTVIVSDLGLPPTVDLGVDIAICEGEMISIDPVSSHVTSWLWQDHTTDSTFVIDQPGLVFANVTNACGSDSDTILVVQLPAILSFDLGPDTSLCPGASFTLSIPVNNVNIEWFDGSNNAEIEINTSGLVYATITNDCGSTADSVVVSSLDAVPDLNLGTDQSLCPGETILLVPAIPNVQYLWQDGSTAVTYNATESGNIILSISNGCGVSIDTMVITENSQGPQVDLGPDIRGCEGDIVLLSANIGGVNYQWQDGSTDPDFSISVSGTYILQVSNSCGSDADTVLVNIDGEVPVIALGNDTILCDSEIMLLITSPDPETETIWQDGSSLPSFLVSTAGIYFVSATNHCGSDSDSIEVDYLALPIEFDIGPDTILCPGESITLQPPLNNLHITWQDGSHGTSYVADHEGLFSVHLENACGTTSDSIQVRIDDRIPVITLDPILSWCKDDIITLDATQPFTALYSWNTGSIASSIQIETPGVYAISIITECSSVHQEIEIVEDERCDHGFFIPTVFSPNDDQVNDIFSLSFGPGTQVTGIQCSIFDRWGNQVFVSNQIGFQWDGTNDGKPLMPGVYVYLIQVEEIQNEKMFMFSRIGDLTLIR